MSFYANTVIVNPIYATDRMDLGCFPKLLYLKGVQYASINTYRLMNKDTLMFVANYTNAMAL